MIIIMQLRSLEPADAEGMYTWLSDSRVTSGLNGKYDDCHIQDAKDFILKSERTLNVVHKAIVTDDNSYVGTVSLRFINDPEETAELAIVVKSDFFGKGYAWFGVVSMLKYAFNSLKLHSVYWRVKSDNERAIRFFQKHGFNSPDMDIPETIMKRHQCEKNLVWFVAINGDDFENKLLSKGTVAGCQIIRIKTIPTVEAGELSFFEATHDVPFAFKRVYYISKVPEGMRRGFHAHKELKQLLFCPYGKIQLILENDKVREEIELSDPSIGVVIEKPTWREMLWMQKDSVLCVAASDYYRVDDYIRNYDDFLQFIGKNKG